MTHNDLFPWLSDTEVTDVMDALRQLGATDIRLYFRILLRERDHLRAENERLRELLTEAVFDGSVLTNDWKDRVHELLGRE